MGRELKNTLKPCMVYLKVQFDKIVCNRYPYLDNIQVDVCVHHTVYQYCYSAALYTSVHLTKVISCFLQPTHQ